MDALKAPTGIVLFDAKVELQHSDKSQEFSCKVYFDLKRGNSLVIDILESVDAIYSAGEKGSFWVRFPNVKDPVECFVSYSKPRLETNKFAVYIRLTPRYSLIAVDYSTALVRVNAGILNLGHYLTGAPGGLSIFSLSHDDWCFDFTPVIEPIMLYPPAIQDEEYFFTHHVCMYKTSGSQFSPLEAHSRLADLSKFFSFCHGHWVGTSLAYGVNKAGTVEMEEWGTHQVSRWSTGSNWLDEHHGKCMVELFPLFMQLIESSSEWMAAIDHTIYWYVRADTNLIGPDGAIVILQAALERLAWHILVRERKFLSKDGFLRLPAHDRFRRFLSALSVPLALPPGLVGLHKMAKELNWEDGPRAFVGIRNRIVHPPKSSPRARQFPYYEAYLLGKWYVELAVLSACGYRGVYSNQTQHRWTGQVEPVPWAV